jgi:soluble lytic murein transglycosylase-like protein
VSEDLDAEFARAADLLEQGLRADAERVLAEVRRKASQRAWDARVAFLLAADDERRGDSAAAARNLAEAPAAAIGLDPYRRLRLARALAATGRDTEALEEWRAAFETEQPYAMRVGTGRRLSVELERRKRPAEALRVLEAVAAHAASSEFREVSIARIRVGLAVKDQEAVARAARDLLLRAPRADLDKGTPVFAKQAMRRQERRLAPADRARRGRALVAAGDARRGVALLLAASRFSPAEELGASLLALARGQVALKQTLAAERTAARVPDGKTPEFFEARLLRTNLILQRLEKAASGRLSEDDPRLLPIRDALFALAAPPSPAGVRRIAQEKLLRIAAESEDFDLGLLYARDLARETRGTIAGFEPLWHLAWARYRAGDLPEARRRFQALAEVYDDIWRDRRLSYWQARCLEREGQAREAAALYQSIAAADPPDIYASFARRRVKNFPIKKSVPLPDPSTATASFRRADELLRLRMFEEASAEARALPPSRGRDLRLAEADFALGRFSSAAAAAKRAFPEIGTAWEGRVPDGWRRLHYPVEEGGFLPAIARDSGLDPAMLRGLVRQESVFAADAKSHAGALGLTQLMPATAKGLVRSVLRVRYRRAFLYDPGVNARLGAAYLKSLFERFDGNSVFALAAYNGGPTRMARLLRENAGLPEDEVFESHPAYETRHYVRVVLLFAESYRTLYPD